MTNDDYVKLAFTAIAVKSEAIRKLREEIRELEINAQKICEHPAVSSKWEYWSEGDEYGGCGYHPRYTCSMCGFSETGWTPKVLFAKAGRFIASLGASPK